MNKLKLLLTLSLGLPNLAACQSAPPNTTVCTELDLNRAYCIKTITGQSGYVDDVNKLYDAETDTEYTWWDLRTLTVAVPYNDWRRLKVWIIETCKQTGKCDDAISSWDRTILNLDAVIEAKAGFQNKKK